MHLILNHYPTTIGAVNEYRLLMEEVVLILGYAILGTNLLTVT